MLPADPSHVSRLPRAFDRRLRISVEAFAYLPARSDIGHLASTVAIADHVVRPAYNGVSAAPAGGLHLRERLVRLSSIMPCSKYRAR